jgi:hypothetical protein
MVLACRADGRVHGREPLHDHDPERVGSLDEAFCVALAVREMRMTPAEALWAATAGGSAPWRAGRHSLRVLN